MRPFTAHTTCPSCETLAHHLLDEPRAVTMQTPAIEVSRWGSAVPVLSSDEGTVTVRAVERTCRSCRHTWDEESE